MAQHAIDPQERLASARKEFGEWGGVNASVEVSTTFTVLDAATMPAIFTGQLTPDNGSCYVYGRSFNPTVRHLGRQLAAMEGTEAGYACSSGIAAISSTLLALCNSGDHIVASNAVYGGTYALMKGFLPTKAGIHTTFVDIANLDAVAAAITPHTKVLYAETLSNPTLVVADLPRLAAIARQHGVKLVVDNTFTPLIITPARWGADVVVHSLTKFISGASDIIAGAVCGPSSFILQMMDLQMGPLMLLGPTMDPKVASELSLRIPHLAVRMAEHSARAHAFASGLHALSAKVNYPGLPSHPQHELLERLVNPGYGYGGILGLDMGSQHLAEQLMERLQNQHGFGLMAVSLGYFDSLLSCSAASTSSELSAADLASAGIQPAYVRISVGLTGSLEQRWQQLREAYLHVASVGALLPSHFNKQAPFAALAAATGGNSSSDSDCTIKHPNRGPSPTPAPSHPHDHAPNPLPGSRNTSPAPPAAAPPAAPAPRHTSSGPAPPAAQDTSQPGTTANDPRLTAATLQPPSAAGDTSAGATATPASEAATASEAARPARGTKHSRVAPASEPLSTLSSMATSEPLSALPSMASSFIVAGGDPNLAGGVGPGGRVGADAFQGIECMEPWKGGEDRAGEGGLELGASEDDATPMSKRARLAVGAGLVHSSSFNSMYPLPQQQQ